MVTTKIRARVIASWCSDGAVSPPHHYMQAEWRISLPLTFSILLLLYYHHLVHDFDSRRVLLAAAIMVRRYYYNIYLYEGAVCTVKLITVWDESCGARHNIKQYMTW